MTSFQMVIVVVAVSQYCWVKTTHKQLLGCSIGSAKSQTSPGVGGTIYSSTPVTSSP